MNNFFNMDNKFFTVLSKACDILFLSVVWALLCIPVITIGPATTAMYYVIVKVIRRERGYLFREFFKAFKSNFKYGAISGVILTVIFLILYFDQWHYSRQFASSGNNVDFILLAMMNAFMVIAISITIYIFPILSRFNMTLKQLFKTAFYMSMKHLPSTVAMLIIVIAAYFACLVMPVVLFILPGTVAFLCSLFLERIFKKYMPKSEGSPEETGKDEWYLE